MEAPRMLALWSAPRSRSTAFLRMMLERDDFTVLHEPFSHVIDFGATAVDGMAVHDEASLIAAIRRLSLTRPVFFKDTTDFRYPGLLADHAFQRDATHTFIIRRPAEILASYFALTPDLKCEDVGIDRLCEIYDAITAQGGPAPIVVDSDDLVRQPEATVRAYCAAAGIPFLDSALTWGSGMLSQWQRTSRWHESTSRSTGFAAPTAGYPQTVHNNPALASFCEHHQPFYDRLHAVRLAVGTPRYAR